VIFPLCFTCKHFDRNQPRGVLKCAAFPSRIPEAILLADANHREPYPGDHGIRYEPQANGPAYPASPPS
jgi:hypothetical protein